MEIKCENLLYRLFMWCIGLCEKSTGKAYLQCRYQYRTNLCHFVRVICLYMPLILISNVLAYCMVAAVFILPFFLFSLKSIGFVLLIIAAAVATALLLFWLVYIFTEGIIRNWFKENEVFHVAGEYIKAKKEKICPYIYFKESE